MFFDKTRKDFVNFKGCVVRQNGDGKWKNKIIFKETLFILKNKKCKRVVGCQVMHYVDVLPIQYKS